MAANENVSLPGKADVAAAAEPQSPVGVAGRWRYAVVVVGLFLASAAASWLMRSGRNADDPVTSENPNPTRSPTPPGVSTTARPPADEKADIGRGDDLLRQGRYEQALAVYQSQMQDAKDERPDTLEFRIALCLEGLGKSDKALAACRTVSTRNTGSAGVVAHLGMARLHIARGEFSAAANLLYPFLLQAQRLPSDSPALAEAQYMLALALAFQVSPRKKPGALHEGLSLPALTDWNPHRHLDWLTSPAARPAEAKTQETFSIQGANNKATAQILQASLPAAPLATLIDRLIVAGNLQPDWTVQARKAVDGRTAALDLSHRPLLDAIQALAEPHGLICQLKDGTVQIRTTAEISEQGQADHQVAVAERALRSVIVDHPGHPWAAHAYLALGNFDAAARRVPEALAWFERILNEAPRSRLVIEASYNRGLLLAKQGHVGEARKALFRIVDQSPGHELAPIAYLRIGRMALEEGDAAQAISLLRRAEAFAAGSDSHPLAVLMLAAAYAATDSPQEANTLLEKYRPAMKKEPIRQTAAFLAAYAQYRDAALRKQLRREAHDLHAALLGLREEALLGPFGKVLLGMAYRDLAMWDHAVKTYESALAQGEGPLREEMAFSLGEALIEANRPGDAVRYLTPLAEGKSRWAPSAELKLATIDLHARRYADSRNRCRKLLQNPTLDRKLVLAIMGQAFDGLGDHQQAARCFAGQIPE
jgi:tetratricopeptide (TPR) repeat protein